MHLISESASLIIAGAHLYDLVAHHHTQVVPTHLKVGQDKTTVLFNDALNTFFYCYMASDIWLRTIVIVRKETHRRHMDNVF